MKLEFEMDTYKSEIKPTWCPGCGDFAVLRALQTAIHALQLEPWNVVIVSGIGCSSNLPHFLSTYGFHAIHGRALPVAEGAKLANPELHVIVTGGDGDGYGIGVGHFIHAMRRNIDITYLVMNNQIYGLTTGQASPTSEKGMKTKSTPIAGVIENPVDPISLALASGATYVARGFSGDVKGMSELVKNGITHHGFSLIDCMSPCVTYNKVNTYDFFRERVYDLAKEGHDPSDMKAAFAKAIEWPFVQRDRIPLGLFYRTEDVPTYEDLEPALKKGPPVHQPLGVTLPGRASINSVGSMMSYARICRSRGGVRAGLSAEDHTHHNRVHRRVCVRRRISGLPCPDVPGGVSTVVHRVRACRGGSAGDCTPLSSEAVRTGARACASHRAATQISRHPSRVRTNLRL